ncbi:hypothetical protein ACEQ8H_000931 [Pleosporales sp. CAS-2024a]
MAPWFALFEAWAVAKLVRSPAFNRAIHRAYRKINGLPDLEPKNGRGSESDPSSPFPPVRSHSDSARGTGPSALDHFKDEVKTQFRELTWQKRPPK